MTERGDVREASAERVDSANEETLDEEIDRQTRQVVVPHRQLAEGQSLCGEASTGQMSRSIPAHTASGKETHSSQSASSGATALPSEASAYSSGPRSQPTFSSPSTIAPVRATLTYWIGAAGDREKSCHIDPYHIVF